MQASEVEFFSGTTDALNIIGHSIHWRAGDEVVVAEDEFPSVRLAWQAAEKAGANIKHVVIPSEAERESALIAALSVNTRVLAVAHVHTFTGTRLDLDKLGAACRSRDCLLVVDGIHALGATPVDLENVDVWGRQRAVGWIWSRGVRCARTRTEQAASSISGLSQSATGQRDAVLA